MPSMNTAIGRIYFLDVLRGIAVLLVMWGHIFLVGINDPKTVSIWIPTVKDYIFGLESLSLNIHGKLGGLVAFKTGVTSGPLGVALFFLISGFVILMTIEKLPPIYFLIRRFFRIVPVCGAAVLGTAAFTWLFCAINGITQPNSISSVLTSTFALNYFNHAFTTIPVLWTLEVEMAFYLFIALTALIFKRIGFKVILLMSLFCASFILFTWSQIPTKLLSSVNSDRMIHIGSLFVHISFMLIGAIIYRGYSDKNPKMAYFTGTAALLFYFACFFVFGKASGGRNIGVNLPDNLAALALFLVAFKASYHGPKFKSLQSIGRISYPLYLVHVPLGWGILAFLGRYGWGMNASAFVSVLVVTLLAYAMHMSIEMPSQKFGKKIKLPAIRNRFVIKTKMSLRCKRES